MPSLCVDPEFHIEKLCGQLQVVPVDMTGVQHARCAVSRVGARRLRPNGGVCPALRQVVRLAMSDPLIALGVAVALAAYLIYALIHPEKF